MEGPALDLKALHLRLHMTVVQEEGLEGLLLWGDSTCSLGIQVSPFVGFVRHLVAISWNCTFPGREQGLAQKTQSGSQPSPPTRRGLRLGPPRAGQLLFQPQKEDLKNMGVVQPSGVRPWGQWPEKWARGPTA